MDLYTEFRVVRILDEFSIVIDGGYNHGIKKGDLFQIYTPGEEITDPDDSKTVLGTLDITKANVIASDVSPTVTICKNSETGYTLNPELSKILSSIAPKTRPLYIDPTQVQSTNLKSEPIKIGDRVRKLPK